ncbi:hypothetical protein [Photobacterium halotolerans]|uniref:hypothetical protein n=1 Tax=Photobacterium halotolerans TaxID=265726 RepID=UPI0013732BAE|nr:hypothetical protein [Photobacterium halotolerans]
MSRLSSVFISAWFDARQVLFVGAKSTQKAPFCSLVWSGSVVGAPGADNLKIRPEFFPVGVGFCWFFEVLWLWVLVRLWYVALECGDSFGMVRCAPDTLCGQRVSRNPFCSLVLAGAVVGAPGADNLKIRPEFFPGGVGLFRFFGVLWFWILVQRRYVALEFSVHFGMV